MRGGQQLVSRVAVTAKFHTPRRTVPHGHSAKVANHPGQQSRTPPRRLRAAAAGVPGPGRPVPAPCAPPPSPSINAPRPPAGRGGRGLRPGGITTAARTEAPNSRQLCSSQNSSGSRHCPARLRPGRCDRAGARAWPVRGAAPGRASGSARSPLGVRRLPPPLPPPPPCECSGV